MKILGFEIKKVNNNQQFVKQMSRLGFNYIGTNINSCGDVIFTLNTFYEIQQFSTEAQAYKNKIKNWIGKNGIYLVNQKGKIVDDRMLVESIMNVFSDTTRQGFKDKYFTHHFSSGDIYMYPQKNLLNETKAQVIDSRTMEKKIDKQGNVVGYKQIVNAQIKDYQADAIYNSIVRYNPNNPFYGSSIYESVIYDALAEKETSRRNYYFFKNNAMPNVLFMLNPEITDPDQIELAKEEIKSKYSGTENAYKFMVSNGVQDIKILDVTNKDLDLIQMRDFAIKKLGIVFQIDPRLIGYVNDVGTYNSIKEIRNESKETLHALSNQFENDLNNFYRTYVDRNFKYIIKVDSETFDDRESIQENQRKDIELGLLTINEVRKERGLAEYTEDFANKPIIKNSLITGDMLLTNSTPTNEQIL